MLWLILIVVGAILWFVRKRYEVVVPPIENLPTLPTESDPKLVRRVVRNFRMAQVSLPDVDRSFRFVRLQAQLPKNKRRVAVFGGSGNIGYVITELLCQDEYYDEVVIMDIRPPAHGLPDNVKNSVSFTRVDITNKESCIQSLTGFTHVAHTAALIDLRDNAMSRFRCYQVNVRGTWNVLNAAILNGVQSYVYTTSAVLGQTEEYAHCEDEEELLYRARVLPYPTNAYRASKITATNLVLEANGKGGLRTCSVGFSIPFGPYDNLMLPSLRNGMIRVFHKNTPPITVASALSIAEGHCLALKKMDESPQTISGQIFMMADLMMQYHEFYNSLHKALGKPGTVPAGPYWLLPVLTEIVEIVDWFTHGTINNVYLGLLCRNGSQQTRANVSLGPSTKAQKLLGFKPRTLEEGIKWFVEGVHKLDAKMATKKN